MRKKGLIVYRDFDNGQLFTDFVYLMENYNKADAEKEKLQQAELQCRTFQHLRQLQLQHL